MDDEVIKQSVFLFSGSIKFQLTDSEVGEGEKLEGYMAVELARKNTRRFDNDKVQCAQLITQKLSGVEQYMLIIQFNDCIVQASFNEAIFKVICRPDNMIRRHMIRGYNEKVYFAQSHGTSQKIQQLAFHVSKSNEITNKAIFQLQGAPLVAFEADPDHIENDIKNDNCA